jgi:DMSO/TMAO reductase YedYZ molybdopterin-dependent catalytic subunit
MLRAGLAGMAAAAVAVGFAELVGAIVGVSVVAAVGGLVIDLQPPGAKDLMVSLFGESDKLALEVGVVAGGVAVGGLLGVVGRRDVRLASAGLVIFGLIAYMLALRDPLASPLIAVLPVGAAVGVGLWLLPRLLSASAEKDAPVSKLDSAEPAVAEQIRPGPLGRRSFVALAAGLIAGGGLMALAGRLAGSQPQTVGDGPPLPIASQTLPPLPAAADFGLEGLTPIVVHEPDFYRIDTRLSVPRIDAATWRLRIHGMVARELTLSYDELLEQPLIERYVTIACVSNNVGGYLVGNARWTGTLLRPLLERAGVEAAASQIVGRSFDGWTAGFPTAHLDGAGAESMITVAMNGEPLPAQHGYPARLIVPGLYGYVSATKWLTEIEMTTLDGFDAYWVPLGWAKEAPILTQSRIDLPRAGAPLVAGPVETAGVAWAPTRGISRVEVQLDDGAWLPAELSLALADTAWVQWRLIVEVPAGEHVLRVRATDGAGETQTERRTPPAPDGARGYHERRIRAA